MSIGKLPAKWRDVLELTQGHIKTWRDEPQARWLAGLMAEVGELADALHGKHEHSPDWELEQIAAIALNWLDMRDHFEEVRAREPLIRRGGSGILI